MPYDYESAMGNVAKIIDSMANMEMKKADIMGRIAEREQNWFYKKQEIDYKNQQKQQDPYAQIAQQQLAQRQEEGRLKTAQEKQLGDFAANYLRGLETTEFPTRTDAIQHFVKDLKIKPSVLTSNPRFIQAFQKKYGPEFDKDPATNSTFKMVRSFLNKGLEFAAKTLGVNVQNTTVEDSQKAISEYQKSRAYDTQQASIQPEKVQAAIQQIKSGDATIEEFKAGIPEAINAGYWTQAEYDEVLKQLGE